MIASVKTIAADALNTAEAAVCSVIYEIGIEDAQKRVHGVARTVADPFVLMVLHYGLAKALFVAGEKLELEARNAERES